MNATETETSDELFMHIPLEQLTASRFQPKSRQPDTDLVASVRQHGVVTPGLARPTPDGPTAYEVVFGHCRWAAAAAAELPSMPFVVRVLDDVTALELMLVENLRRSDLHPMDEAEGYHQLHEEHRQAVEVIADRVGKSKGYVYARLKLLALQTEGREAFRAGDLDASVALYLARVPGSLQHMALKELRARAENRDGEKISAREAAGILQRNYMLQLGEAPFDLGDSTLVAPAGACTECPKRTGNQRELFSDVASADVCTDPICYRSKVDALWQIRTRQKGASVMSASKTKELWPHGGRYFSGHGEWTDLRDTCYQVPGNKTWKQLLAAAMPAITLARDPDGGVHELVKQDAAQKALVALDLVAKAKPSSSSSSKSKAPPEPKLSPARQLAEKVTAAAAAAVVDAAEKGRLDKPVMLLLANEALDQLGGFSVAERRGMKSDAFTKSMAKMSLHQLFGVLVEAIVGFHSFTHDDKVDSHVVDACKAFGVDLKAIEKKAKAELEAAAKVPAELKAKPVKGKKFSAQALKHGALGPEGKR